MTEKKRVQCDALVYRRDTYRYTGGTKSGFVMHRTKGQCARMAVEDGLCRQHAKRGVLPFLRASVRFVP